jgi:hypothetical protein
VGFVSHWDCLKGAQEDPSREQAKQWLWATRNNLYSQGERGFSPVHGLLFVNNTEKVGNTTLSQIMTVIEICWVYTVGQARARLYSLPSLNELVLSKSFLLHLSFVRLRSVWFFFDSESGPSYMCAVSNRLKSLVRPIPGAPADTMSLS